MTSHLIWIKRAALLAALAMPLAARAEEPANPFAKEGPAETPASAPAAEAPTGRIPRSPRPESRSKGRAVDPKEFIQRMMREDVNGDGILDKGEFHGPEKQFARADANGDGKLDKDEVEAAAFAMASRKGPMGDSMAPGGEPDPAGLIEALDKNKDGKIERDEAGERLAKSFDRMDANKDGALEKKEVASAIERRPRRGPSGPPPSAEEMIQRLDADASGKIEPGEARGPISDGFEEVDTNKDGGLDKSEIDAHRAKMMERMGGEPGERGPRPEGGRKRKRGDAPREGRPDHAAMMKKMDANNDGFLQPSELLAGKTGKPGKPDAFDKLDTDGDGKISPEEFKAFKPPRDGAGKGGKKSRKKGETPAAAPAKPAA